MSSLGSVMVLWLVVSLTDKTGTIWKPNSSSEWWNTWQVFNSPDFSSFGWKCKMWCVRGIWFCSYLVMGKYMSIFSLQNIQFMCQGYIKSKKLVLIHRASWAGWGDSSLLLDKLHMYFNIKDLYLLTSCSALRCHFLFHLHDNVNALCSGGNIFCLDLSHSGSELMS